MLARFSSFLFLCLFFAADLSSAAFVVPPLTDPVEDLGRIISNQDKQTLRALIRDFHRRGQAQLQILTVPSLEDTPIEQASIQVTDSWKIGDKKRDDGVLLMVAVKERRIRIEVGQGLEGILPDVIAKGIIDNLMKPIMRERSPSQGIVAGAVQIMRTVSPDMEATPPEADLPKQSPFQRLEGFLFLIFLIFIVLGNIIKPRRRGFLGGGWGGGGGFGGFGGGGGGWSGGGGGFSGGGASGNW